MVGIGIERQHLVGI
jgi:bacteriocin-like protein